MTEKSYGGANNIPKPKQVKSSKTESAALTATKPKEKIEKETDILSAKDIEKLRKAGEIAKKVKEYGRTIVKKGVPLLEIATKIDEKIAELGAKPAFPLNLSINEIAAHSTPSYNDETKAHGLLKFDVGIQVDGFVADTAFSIDLENSQENKKIIEAAESALKKALEAINYGVELRQVGATVEKEVKAKGFQPIINLSGHSIDEYDLHSGITIPNYDNHQFLEIPEGAYAVEPFVTSGAGQVINGKPSGIYAIQGEGAVRDQTARELLNYIVDEYQTLPFCSRWLVQKFGTRALIALKRLEEAGILHHYPQLLEKSRAPVAQAEHTVIITKKEKIVTT